VPDGEDCDTFDKNGVDFGPSDHGCAAVHVESSTTSFDIGTDEYKKRPNEWRFYEEFSDDGDPPRKEFEVRRHFRKVLLREEDDGRVIYLKADS
jgi:hypothetical protein